MESIIAYCGIICDSCPIHLATFEKDKSLKQSMRESIAEQCSKLYGMNMQSEDISDCDGCRANTGRIFQGCLDCEIRKCASKKNIDNCAFCDDYACEKLRKHFSQDPSAKVRLEEIRQNKCDKTP